MILEQERKARENKLLLPTSILNQRKIPRLLGLFQSLAMMSEGDRHCEPLKGTKLFRNKAFLSVMSISLFLGISSQLVAVPKNVILIRHAEKTPGENQLNLKGFERASALPYYFSHTSLYNNPPISHIFASGLQTINGSVRPLQTCSSIANYYNLPSSNDTL